MAKLKRLFNRVVPIEWEKELAEISPPNGRFLWLKLQYRAGYPWEPIERYMIYQMTPAHLMEVKAGQKPSLMSVILEQLQDPDPPSAHGNFYDKQFDNGDGTTGKFIRNPDCLITEHAWQLYRETGCWGRPYWIIQGDKGGHKWEFTKAEKKLLMQAGLPRDPPRAGDLPYAEWDDKVKAKLMLLDMLRGQHGERRRAAAVAKGHSVQEEHEKELQLELRKNLVKFLADQVSEIAPDAHKALLEMDAPYVHHTKEETLRHEERMEQAEEDFIQTGDSKHSLLITR